MHGSRLRRIAATTALTLAITLVASDVPALGVELPAQINVGPDPALGAGPTLPSTSQLPSTPGLPLSPSGPTLPATPLPLAPAKESSVVAGPAGPSGSQPAAPAQSQPSSTRRKGRVLGSRLDLGDLSAGDRSPERNAARVVSYAGQARPARKTRERRRIAPDSPAFRLFHPSQLSRLGEVLGGNAPRSSQFLGGFSGSATGSATWAPPLLAIMLLIGLGGFLQAARFPRRGRS